MDLFGGRGEVLIWDLLGKTALEPFRAVLACELAPGGSVGTHVQEEFPELVVITAGMGRVMVEGEERVCGPGALVALPLGARLAIANASAETPLHYMILKAAAPPP